MAYLKLIRAKNLVIVAITQFLLQFLVVGPYHIQSGTEPVLDPFHFSLLVLVTVLIAAGGYVINDIKDIEIDKINKPKTRIIEKQISEEHANWLYWGTTIIGAIISIYMAFWVEKPLWFLLFPIAVFMLWSYSVYFKKSYLVGNIIVSFFAAGVAGIVLFPEVFCLVLTEINQKTIFLIGIFLGYIFFAFSSTMMREIVKDMEDSEGDKAEGASTFPIVEGLKMSKILAGIWGILLAVGLAVFLWILHSQGHNLALIFGIFLVWIPILFAIFKIYNSQTVSDFHEISQVIKVIMLAGLCFLIFIVKVNF